jgi:putative nucleotidyltransferase with HDIG domain
MVEGSVPAGEWDIVVLGDGQESEKADSVTGARRLAEALSAKWKWREPVSFERYGTHLVSGPAGTVEISQEEFRTGLRNLSNDPLVQDAMTRDFTINALYIPLSSPSNQITVLDPTGKGFDDLADRLLRTPVQARLTIKDDPLRILRAARFCSTGGYRVSSSFSRTAKEFSGRLCAAAPERIRDEMNKLLTGGYPSVGLDRLARWGVFAVIMPEVQGMVGFRQRTPHHYPDLFRHTMRVVDRIRPDLVLRWAALLHDCGKPHTRVEDGDVDRYFGHEGVGAELAGDLLNRMRVGKGITRDVTELIRLHMVQYTEQWSDRAVRRFVNRSRDQLPRLMDLLEADSRALRLRAEKLRLLNELRGRVEGVMTEMPVPGSPLDGNRIMELLNIEQGSAVGSAKNALAEAVTEGLISTQTDAAERYLIHWWKGRGDRQT